MRVGIVGVRIVLFLSSSMGFGMLLLLMWGGSRRGCSVGAFFFLSFSLFDKKLVLFLFCWCSLECCSLVCRVVPCCAVDVVVYLRVSSVAVAVAVRGLTYLYVTLDYTVLCTLQLMSTTPDHSSINITDIF